MNEQERQNLFTALISRHQNNLHGYIYAIVRNWEDTDDLYQSVCLVLWNKFESFRPDSDFFAWARQTARNKIGDYVRRKPSPNYATEKLMDILSGIAIEPHDTRQEGYLVALRRCKEKLTDFDAELLRLRYVEELNTIEIADQLQRLRPSVSRSLSRIRRWLFECIKIELVKHK